MSKEKNVVEEIKEEELPVSEVQEEIKEEELPVSEVQEEIKEEELPVKEEPEVKTAFIPIKLKVVKCNRLNVRATPELNGQILGTVDAGSVLKCVSIEDAWASIVTKDNLKGFVMLSFTQKV